MSLPDFGGTGTDGKPEDNFGGPEPEYVPRTRGEARALEQEQRGKIKEATQAYNYGSEQALEEAGIEYKKDEQGFVQPRYAPSNEFGRTVEFGTSEFRDPITEETRQIDKTGKVKPKKRQNVTYKSGDANNPNFPNPSRIYRVYTREQDAGVADPNQPFAATKAEDIGSAFDLQGVSDQGISSLAKETVRKNRQYELGSAKSVLDARGQQLDVESETLKSQIDTLNQTPIPDWQPDGDKMDPAIASEVGGKADAKSRQDAAARIGMSRDQKIADFSSQLAEKNKERIRNRALQVELQSQMSLDEGESIYDNRVQQLLKNGAKQEDIDKDPLIGAIREGLTNIQKPVLPLSEVFKDPSLTPQAIYETRASQREKGRIEAEGRLAKEKATEFLKPFIEQATDTSISYTTLAGRRNRLSSVYNKLLDDADAADTKQKGSGLNLRAQASGYAEAIGVLDDQLSKVGKQATIAEQSAKIQGEFAKENEKRVQQELQGRLTKLEQETKQKVEKLKQRRGLEDGTFMGPPAPGDVPPATPTQGTPPTQPTTPQPQPESPTSWFKGGLNNLFSKDTMRQAARGYFELNQKFASGIYLSAANALRLRGKEVPISGGKLKTAGAAFIDAMTTSPSMPAKVMAALSMVDRQFGGKLHNRAAKFFEESATAAKENETAIREEKFLGLEPVSPEWRESDVGQVVKSLTELPFYIGTTMINPAVGFIATFGTSYDDAIQNQLNAGVKNPDHVTALAEAIPVAAFEQLGNMVELGLAKALGKKFIQSLQSMTARSLRGLFASAAMKIGGGAITEGGEEGVQQFWSNMIAKYIGKFDPTRPLDKDVWKSIYVAMWAGGAGVTAMGGGSVALTGAQNYLNERGLKKQADEMKAATEDIPANGWEDWGNKLPEQILDPGLAESFGEIGADLDEQQGKFLVDLADSIKGAPFRRLIDLGKSIDESLIQPPALQSRAAGILTGAKNEQLIGEANLYAERANLAALMQSEAQLRLRVAREIGELPTDPMDGGLDQQAAGLIAAKVLFGSSGVTQEELKAKYRGMLIIQTDSNGIQVPSEFVKQDIFSKAPTMSEQLKGFLSRVNQAMANQTDAGGASAEPPEPPKPEQEPTGKPRQVDQANLKTPRQIAEASARTGSPALMARLEGTTPDERWASAESKIKNLVTAIGSKGLDVRFVSDGAASSVAFEADNKTLRISLNKESFMDMENTDPEANNRYVREEIAHLGDIAEGALDAKRQGKDNYRQHWEQQRANMLSRIFTVAKQDKAVEQSVVAAANLYLPKVQRIMKASEMRMGANRAATDDALVRGAVKPQFKTVSDIQQYMIRVGMSGERGVRAMPLFMAEMLRMLKTYGQPQTEARNFLQTAAKISGGSRTIIKVISDYLRKVYKALFSIKDSLVKADPQLAEDLSNLLSEIDDVLSDSPSQPRPEVAQRSPNVPQAPEAKPRAPPETGGENVPQAPETPEIVPPQNAGEPPVIGQTPEGGQTVGTIAPPATRIVPRGRMVSVTYDKLGSGGVESVTEQVQLTKEQEVEWEKGEADYRQSAEMAKRTRDPAMRSSLMQRAGYEWAKRKREITGRLHYKEQREKEAREKKNYLGKKVGVQTEGGVFAATITGNPFGRVKVRLEDGQELTVLPDQLTSAPEIEQEQSQDPTAIPSGQVVDFPINKIVVNDKIQQFKKKAKKDSGVVKALTGEYQATPKNPIVIWQRNDGVFEVITGRHRLDLAKRNNMATIPAQIVKESEGWTQEKAETFDAEANIRDGQGDLEDFAYYFRKSGISQQDAEAKGLLRDDGKGKAGFLIANEATEDVYSGVLMGKIDPGMAYIIASSAPRSAGALNEGIQRQALALITTERTNQSELKNFIAGMVAKFADQGPSESQGDLFGGDDSALELMKQRAKKAAKKQKGLKDELNALLSYKKLSSGQRAKILADRGISIGAGEDVDGRIAKEITDLQADLASWERWATDPAKVSQIDQMPDIKAQRIDIQAQRIDQNQEGGVESNREERTQPGTSEGIQPDSSGGGISPTGEVATGQPGQLQNVEDGRGRAVPGSVDQRPDGGSGENQGLADNAVPTSLRISRGPQPNLSAIQSLQRREPRGEVGRASDVNDAERVLGEGLETQIPWVPVIQGNGVSLKTFAPVGIADEIRRNLERIDSERGGLENYVSKALGFGDVSELYRVVNPKAGSRFNKEQVETIAASLDRMDAGKACIIGHEMGIGKGRICAALLYAAYLRGQIPVFFTANSRTLYPTLMDDFRDLGFKMDPFITDQDFESVMGDGNVLTNKGKNPKALFDSIAASKKLPAGKTLVMTTWEQARLKDVNAVLNALAPNAVFIIDEAHKGTGDSLSSEVARGILKKAKGVSFSSGTAIKNLEAMRLYFPFTSVNRAVPSVRRLNQLLKKFANPLLELMNRGLVSAGEYIRYQRGLTHNGLPVPFTPLALRTGPQVAEVNETANEIAGELKQIQAGPFMKQLRAVLQPLAKTKAAAMIEDKPELAETLTIKVEPYPMKSQFHNIANIMVLASKIPEISKQIKTLVDQGNKVFVASDSTGEAAVQELLDDVSLETDPKNASFADALARYTDKLRYVTITAKVGPKGRQQTLFRQKLDLNRAQEEYPEAVERAQQVLQQISDAKSMIESSRDVLGRLGISPMDTLRQQLESVQIPSVEISGRSATVMPDGTREKRTELDQDRMASLSMFNNMDDMNVISVSRSGSTGINAHNSPKFISQKDRVFFLLQPSPNVVDTVQVAFRVNRTGQLTAPHLYMAYAEELPAEKRIMALTAKKMSKLGASSTGGQRLDMSETFGEDMHNAYGDLAIANVLARDETFRQEFQTRHNEYFPGSNEEEIRANLMKGSGNGDVFRRFEHMLIIMPLDIYSQISEQVRDEYNEIVETEKMAGRYNLTSEKMDYKAVLVDDMPGMAPYSPRKEGEPDIGTAQPTQLRRYRFTNPTPPPASEQLVKDIDKVKADTAQLVQKYNESAEKYLSDRVNFINSRSRLDPNAKNLLIQAITRKMAVAQTAVADAAEKVGGSYWYHINDTQVPVFVTGLRLNPKYPHVVASQRLLIQSAGFNHLMPVPLSANPLSRLASARAAFNNNPLEQEELGVEMPLLDVSPTGQDAEAAFYRSFKQTESYAAAKAWENHPFSLREKYMSFAMDRAGYRPGFFRVNRKFSDGKTLNGLYYDGNTIIEMSPVRTREILSFVSERTENAQTEKDVIDAFAEALDATQDIDTMTDEGAVATDEGQKDFVSKMNNRRRNQVVAEAYDRERQKAMQQDHFVIVGNPLVAADMSTRLFGQQLNHRVMRFTNQDGGETTGIVVPSQAEFSQLKKLSNVLTVRETIQRSDAEKVLDYLNSTITRHHNATEVVFTDGATISYATTEATAIETPHSLKSIIPISSLAESQLADLSVVEETGVPDEVRAEIEKLVPGAKVSAEGPYITVSMGGFDAGNYIARRMRSRSIPDQNAGQRYFYADPKKGEVFGPVGLAALNQDYMMSRISEDTLVYPEDPSMPKDWNPGTPSLTDGTSEWMPYADVAKSKAVESPAGSAIEGYAYSGPRSVQMNAQRIGDEITPEIWNYYRIATQQTTDSDGNVGPSPAVRMVLRMFPNMDASYVEDSAVSGVLKAVKALAVMRTQDPGKFAEMEGSAAPEGGIPKKVFSYMVEAAKNSVLTSYQKFGQYEVDPPEQQGMQMLEDEETVAELLVGRATAVSEDEGPDIVTPKDVEETEFTKALRSDMEAAFQTIDPRLAQVFVAHNRGMTFEAIADEFGLPPIIGEDGKQRPNKQMAQRMYDDALRSLQDFAGDNSLFATNSKPQKPVSKALRLAMEAGLIRPMSINAQRIYTTNSEEDGETANLVRQFRNTQLGQAIMALRSGPQPAGNLIRGIAEPANENNKAIQAYYRLLSQALVKGIEANPSSFLGRAANTDVVIDESIPTSHFSSIKMDPFTMGIIRLHPGQLSPRVILHEFVHSFTAQLIGSEIVKNFQPRRGEMSGSKYREALTTYANKQPLDADNPTGAIPAMQSLVKAYLGALKYAKDDAGQPIENAIFGSGLTASFSITLPMHRASYAGGLHMSAHIDASNSKAIYEHFTGLGLEGKAGVPNDTLDAYVNKNGATNDFFISSPAGSLAGLEVEADGKLILTPSGLEKLRTQNIAPSAYSTYTIRSTKPVFKQRILGVVGDPGKKAMSILYGFKNIDEFSAETMSNPSFVGMIANLDVPKGLTKTPHDYLVEWFDQLESDLLNLKGGMKGAVRNMAAGTLVGSTAGSLMDIGSIKITDYQTIVGNRDSAARSEPTTQQGQLFAQRIGGDKLEDKISNTIQAMPRGGLITTTKGAFSIRPRVGSDGWVTRGIDNPRRVITKTISAAVAGLPGIRGMVQVVKSYTRDDVAPSDAGGEKNPLALEYKRLTDIPTPTEEQRKRISEIEKFATKYKMPGVGVQQSLFDTEKYAGSPNRPTASSPSVIETPPAKFIAPQMELALNAQRIEPSGAKKILSEINDLRAMRDSGQPYNEKRLRQLEFTANQTKLSGYQPEGQLMPTETSVNPTTQPFALEQETRAGMVQGNLFAQRLDYDENGNPVITPKPLTPEELMSIRADLLGDLGKDTQEVMAMYRKLRVQPSGTKTLGGVYQNGENGGPARSLANPGQTSQQRDLINAMDAMRFQRGLGIKQDTAVEDAAIQILSTPEGRLGVQEAVLSGQSLNTETTLAAMKMVGEMVQTAITSGNAEDLGKAYAMTYMYREARSETARALRIGYDRLMTPAQRHAEFLMAVMVQPERNRILDLKYYPTEAQNRNDIRSLQATLEDLIKERNGLLESRQEASNSEEMKAVLEQRNAEIQALQGQISDLQNRVTREQVMAQEAQDRLADVNRTLAGLGTNLEQLMKESELSEIRTGRPATQMLDQVRLSPKEREAVELIMIGHDPVSVSKQTKVKMVDIKGAMDVMRSEAKRRFSQIAQSGMTRDQLRKALLENARTDASMRQIMAQRIPDNQPLGEDEAMEEIYNMLGLTLTPTGEYKWAERKGRSNLFDLRKPEHIVVLAKAMQAGKPTIDGTLFEAYVSSIFSGFATQLANVAMTPASPITTSVHRGFQAITSYLLGQAGINQEVEIDRIDDRQVPLFRPSTAYKTMSEAIRGAGSEIGYILRSVVPAFFEASTMGRLAWATEAGFFDYNVSGVLEDIDDPQTRFGAFLQKYGRTRNTRIPGKLGKAIRVPLRGLLAADEFTKTFRAYMTVGAHAYRLGKAAGLNGAELSSFVEKEVRGAGSTSWMLAARRATKETFTFQLRPEGGSVRSVGDFAAENVGRLSDFYASLENAATAMDGNPVFMPARAALRLIQSFLVLIKSPFNIYREGYSYTPPAILNLISRARRVKETDVAGKKTKYLPVTEYDDFVERLTSFGIGTAVLAGLLTGAAEGDDDDDKKMLLITGTPDPLAPGGQRVTRFGNPPFKFILRGDWLKSLGVTTGEYALDYSRVEPIGTVVSSNVNIARTMKESVRNPSRAGSAGANLFKDYFLAPATRTYGKQWRDLISLFDLEGSGWQRVLRDKLSAIMSPNLFKQPFGGIQEYEKDVYNPDPLAPDALAFAVLPGLGDQLGIPDRRTFEGMKVPNPVPYEGAGPVARSVVRLLPGRFGEGFGKTDFEKFVDNYNRQHPDKRWNPDLSRPDRFFDDKYLRQRVAFTNDEYEMVLKMAAPKIRAYLYGNSSENGALSQKDISGFVSEDRKDTIQRTISGYYRDAKKAVVDARHRRELKALQSNPSK